MQADRYAINYRRRRFAIVGLCLCAQRCHLKCRSLSANITLIASVNTFRGGVNTLVNSVTSRGVNIFERHVAGRRIIRVKIENYRLLQWSVFCRRCALCRCRHLRTATGHINTSYMRCYPPVWAFTTTIPPILHIHSVYIVYRRPHCS